MDQYVSVLDMILSHLQERERTEMNQHERLAEKFYYKCFEKVSELPARYAMKLVNFLLSLHALDVKYFFYKWEDEENCAMINCFASGTFFSHKPTYLAWVAAYYCDVSNSPLTYCSLFSLSLEGDYVTDARNLYYDSVSNEEYEAMRKRHERVTGIPLVS